MFVLRNYTNAIRMIARRLCTSGLFEDRLGPTATVGVATKAESRRSGPSYVTLNIPYELLRYSICITVYDRYLLFQSSVILLAG